MPTHVNDLTRNIIGAAMEVHRALGPGLFESSYRICMQRELHLRGIPFQREHPLPLVYKDITLDQSYKVDILVDNAVVVETKRWPRYNRFTKRNC